MEGEIGGGGTSPFRPQAPAATGADFNVELEENRSDSEPQNPAAVPKLVPNVSQLPTAPEVPSGDLDLELAHSPARPNLAPEVALDLELVQDENQIAGHNATSVVTSDGVAVEVWGDIGLSRALEQQAARVEVAPMVVEVAAITVAESSEAAGNTRKRR